MNHEHVAALLQSTGPLTGALDEALAVAISRAEQECSPYPHEKCRFIRALHVRLAARQELEQLGLPDGWLLAGNPAQMGQLILQAPGRLSLRLLRANPLQPDRIPHAGTNQARVRVWQQPPLDANWPADPSEEVVFLALWDYLDEQARLDGFSLRFVHPIGSGKYRGKVPCDLDVEVPRHGTTFENLSFSPQNQEENLFSTYEILEAQDGA